MGSGPVCWWSWVLVVLHGGGPCCCYRLVLLVVLGGVASLGC